MFSLVIQYLQQALGPVQYIQLATNTRILVPNIREAQTPVQYILQTSDTMITPSVRFIASDISQMPAARQARR